MANSLSSTTASIVSFRIMKLPGNSMQPDKLEKRRFEDHYSLAVIFSQLLKKKAMYGGLCSIA
jgi:hypothetical protein